MSTSIAPRQPYSPPKLKRQKAWRPKNWKPQYDEMIVKSLLGQTNLALATEYGYTPQHVSVILNSPQSLAAKRVIMGRMRGEVKEQLGDRLADLEDMALKRLHGFFSDEEVMRNSPIAVAEKSIQILKGTGALKEKVGDTINAKNAIFMDRDAVATIVDGLHKANEAMRLHSGDRSISVDSTAREADRE